MTTVLYMLLLVFIPAAIAVVLLWHPPARSQPANPRCRRCRFNLRATAGDHCPECGADLNRLGVLPPGAPGRRPRLLLQLVWLAIIAITGLVAIDHADHLFHHVELYPRIVFQRRPPTVMIAGQADSLCIAVCAEAEGVRFGARRSTHARPGLGLEVTDLYIDWAANFGNPVPQALRFDPAARRFSFLTDSDRRRSYPYPLQPPHVIDWYSHRAPLGTPPLEDAEARLIADAANHYANPTTRLRGYQAEEQRARDWLADPSRQTQVQHFQDVGAYCHAATRSAPPWTEGAMLAVLLVPWLVGAWLIRRITTRLAVQPWAQHRAIIPGSPQGRSPAPADHP